MFPLPPPHSLCSRVCFLMRLVKAPSLSLLEKETDLSLSLAQRCDRTPASAAAGVTMVRSRHRGEAIVVATPQRILAHQLLHLRQCGLRTLRPAWCTFRKLTCSIEVGRLAGRHAAELRRTWQELGCIRGSGATTSTCALWAAVAACIRASKSAGCACAKPSPKRTSMASLACSRSRAAASTYMSACASPAPPVARGATAGAALMTGQRLCLGGLVAEKELAVRDGDLIGMLA